MCDPLCSLFKIERDEVSQELIYPKFVQLGPTDPYLEPNLPKALTSPACPLTMRCPLELASWSIDGKDTIAMEEILGDVILSYGRRSPERETTWVRHNIRSSVGLWVAQWSTRNRAIRAAQRHGLAMIGHSCLALTFLFYNYLPILPRKS